MASSERKTLLKYRAYVVLGRKQYHCQVILDEIPESITVNGRAYKLKLVLWNCNNKAKLEHHKYIELQALIYR